MQEVWLQQTIWTICRRLSRLRWHFGPKEVYFSLLVGIFRGR